MVYRTVDHRLKKTVDHLDKNYKQVRWELRIWVTKEPFDSSIIYNEQ